MKKICQWAQKWNRLRWLGYWQSTSFHNMPETPRRPQAAAVTEAAAEAAVVARHMAQMGVTVDVE